jgi:hypothetical protein
MAVNILAYDESHASHKDYNCLKKEFACTHLTGTARCEVKLLGDSIIIESSKYKIYLGRGRIIKGNRLSVESIRLFIKRIVEKCRTRKHLCIHAVISSLEMLL